MWHEAKRIDNGKWIQGELEMWHHRWYISKNHVAYRIDPVTIRKYVPIKLTIKWDYEERDENK